MFDCLGLFATQSLYATLCDLESLVRESVSLLFVRIRLATTCACAKVNQHAGVNVSRIFAPVVGS